MRTINEAINNLIAEVKNVCDENSIPLYIIGNDARRLAKGKEKIDAEPSAELAIRAVYVNRLIEKLAENKERGVEGIFNNSHMPGMYIRYTDTSTFFCNLISHQNAIYSGIHVNIHIIRNSRTKSIKNSILRIQEKAWEYTNRTDYLNGKTFLFRKAVFRLIWATSSSEKQRQKLYDRLIRQFKAAPGEKYEFRMPLTETISISREKLQKCKHAMLNDMKLNVLPVNSRTFFADNSEYIQVNYAVISDANFSKEEYLENANGSNAFDNDKWAKDYAEYISWYVREFTPLDKRVRSYWNWIALTYRRFALWDYYEKRRDIIRDLYEKQDFESLDDELRHYISMLNSYCRIDMGICFDSEIFEITLRTLQEYGKKKIVKKALELVRTEHYESIGEYQQRKTEGKPIDIEMCKERQNHIKHVIETNTFGRRVSDTGNTAEAFRKYTEDSKVHYVFRIANRNCEKEYRQKTSLQSIELNSGTEQISADKGHIVLDVSVDRNLTETERWKKLVEDIVRPLENSKETTEIDYMYFMEMFAKMKLCCIL